jgi:hypothetical protein
VRKSFEVAGVSAIIGTQKELKNAFDYLDLVVDKSFSQLKSGGNRITSKSYMKRLDFSKPILFHYLANTAKEFEI